MILTAIFNTWRLGSHAQQPSFHPVKLMTAVSPWKITAATQASCFDMRGIAFVSFASLKTLESFFDMFGHTIQNYIYKIICKHNRSTHARIYIYIDIDILKLLPKDPQCRGHLSQRDQRDQNDNPWVSQDVDDVVRECRKWLEMKWYRWIPNGCLLLFNYYLTIEDWTMAFLLNPNCSTGHEPFVHTDDSYPC